MVEKLNDLEKKNYYKMLNKHKAVKIYSKVLNGKLKSFPKGYWDAGSSMKEDARMCIRYFIDIELNLDRDGASKISKRTIYKNKLGVMMEKVYNGSLSDAMLDTYRDVFFYWEFKRNVNGFWNKQNAKRAIEDRITLLEWDDKDILEKYSYVFYKEAGLEYMLRTVFDGNLYMAINTVYPNRFMPWEFRCVSRNYWSKERARKATSWMINELDWGKEDIIDKISKNVFRTMGLGGMLWTVYGDSPYEAINDLYPGQFKPWELQNMPVGYWNEKTAIEAIIYLCEEKLGYDSRGIRNNFSEKDLIDNGFEYIYNKFFEKDLYKVVKAMYPGKYRASEIKRYRPKKSRDNDVARSVIWYD